MTGTAAAASWRRRVGRRYPDLRRAALGRERLMAAMYAAVLAAVTVGVTAAALAGITVADARDSFLIANAAIGLATASCGALVAWRRPRPPLGWLLLGAGMAQALSVAAAGLAGLGDRLGWPPSVQRGFATTFLFTWPWAIGVLLPMALLVFPDGRLPSPRWRWAAGGIAGCGSLFVLAHASAPISITADPSALSWLALPSSDLLAGIWTVSKALLAASYLAVIAGLLARYPRGDGRTRRQLLWLLLAVAVAGAVLGTWGRDAEPGQRVLTLLVLVLIPAAIGVAVLRHRLLDIELAASRAVGYALLSAAAIGAYLGLVGAVDHLLRHQAGLGASAAVTLLIAVGFNPVRTRLQRLVDRAVYGDRADPVTAMSRLGQRLRYGNGCESDDEADALDTVAVVRSALRLPYAALHEPTGLRLAHGRPPSRLETLPLSYRGEQVGRLVVGVRAGQRHLDPADRALLELLAAPLAVAVHARTLSAQVQRSRAQLVTAREEERRRLRRDLHDGLGPTLTGIALQADAASNLLHADPERAGQLVTALRRQAADAIADVRRLVAALHPPILDELGLLPALRRQLEQLQSARTRPAITLEAPDRLPPLPAAVEVAAYRIVLEAVTNALRHATRARRVLAELAVDDERSLRIVVRDDAATPGSCWTSGVGLSSIRERAGELGGEAGAGPTDRGGLVWARLPLGEAP